MPWPKFKTGDSPPFKLLLWTAIAGLVFGLLQLGELAENHLRTGRNRLHQHSASGDIVLVAIDDEALRELGRWPWPRRHYAEMVDRLTAAGANRIFFDILFETRSAPADDRLLADAIDRSGRVTLAVVPLSGFGSGEKRHSRPLDMFTEHAKLASVSVDYNYQNAAWRVPFSSMMDGAPIPSFATSLANATQSDGRGFMPDYSVDLTTIPRISASAILDGTIDLSAIAGKDIVIGSDSEATGDQYFIPGHGKMGGAYVHIISAETLKAGNPVDLGWLAPFLLALAAGAFAVSRKSLSHQNLLFGGSVTALLTIPAFLESQLITVHVTAGLFVSLVLWGAVHWQRFRARGLVDSVSGLPNLSALRSDRSGRDKALLVARVLNFAEIAEALPPEEERRLIDQIVARLRVGAPDRILYQGDGGIFAWFEESRLPFGNHIEALHALFRNPARIGELSIDLSVSFGVEIGSSRSLANRLASAMVAAEEAAHDGLKWKYHDPETLENASWKLSMLSQLDSAVDKGEVWVAFQPKLDLAKRRIVGAEALARWTHPEKGPIAASEFIAAAEQHDRIAKLTDFVLEQAIKGAAAVNQRQPGFGIAVNLSARLLSDKGFTLRLSAMLARHHLPAGLLTLELTETAALAGSGAAVDMLGALRELGIVISIDDYGTGLSTLDYLKKIPAGEIKIDQSFVKGMLDNRSDRVMVQSTIALAHSLGRKVVAEGIEQQAVLDVLVDMGCDVGQGYIIGRPMSLEALVKRLVGTRSRVA